MEPQLLMVRIVRVSTQARWLTQQSSIQWGEGENNTLMYKHSGILKQYM